MSRFHSYVNSATGILKEYDGREPFSLFLKAFFRRNKKYGSRDRRQIGHLCYCYFRLGKSLPDLIIKEKILTGLFLCSDNDNEILNTLNPELGEKVGVSFSEKLNILNKKSLLTNVFPYKDELSDGLSYGGFTESFFRQPDLFLRLRPGMEEFVKKKLETEEIEFREVNENCLALPNSVKINQKVHLNKEAVVQDLNSQRIGELLHVDHSSTPVSVWDCCSGSGGKSILMHDTIPNIDLTATDIRDSILVNLGKRFKEAGINKYEMNSADLTQSSITLRKSPFDVIIADVPCTGSGTWGRTPEQLAYFDINKIQEYSIIQRKIISNTIPHLKPGGQLLYITCSVFKKENEENIEFFKKEYALTEIKRELFAGYEIKADTMFACLFTKQV